VVWAREAKNASSPVCGRQPNDRLAATILLVSPAQWVNITRAKLDIFLKPANFDVEMGSKLFSTSQKSRFKADKQNYSHKRPINPAVFKIH